MSKSSVITVVILIVLTVVGWFTLLGDAGSEKKMYKEAVKTGDEWCEMGLYLRATRKYREAIEIDSNEKVWDKMINAYALAYEEEPEIKSDYIDILVEALTVSPGDYGYASVLADLYVSKNDYLEAYECLVAVDEYGINEKRDQDALDEQIREVRYSYQLKGTEYNEFLSFANECYSVMKIDNNGLEKWNVIDGEGSGILDNDKQYAFIGMFNEDEVRVMTTYEEKIDDEGKKYLEAKDGRIRDEDDVTLGIFEDFVEWAGIYSDDRMPAKLVGNDYYAYYDSFAQEVCGGYEAVGTFKDGNAAVCKDGDWFIIDVEGEKDGDEFYEIKLDSNGYYNANDIIIAAEKEGEYCLYDDEWEKIGKFECDDMDICTEDKIIAFKDGDKWGFVDEEGDVVIDPEYSDAKSFSNGLAAVCIDGKWGFIDMDNNLVIPCQYDDADYFNEMGSCMIKTISTESLEDPEAPTEYVWKMITLRIAEVD
ncbi:MAG: WG repeat-containing protein [Oscillospiraceae bacterium]|nr:WG repeat-containing protein [Oscillospiraceae bacterium]